MTDYVRWTSAFGLLNRERRSQRDDQDNDDGGDGAANVAAPFICGFPRHPVASMVQAANREQHPGLAHRFDRE